LREGGPVTHRPPPLLTLAPKHYAFGVLVGAGIALLSFLFLG
jgi:hypothetical protein